VTDKTLVQGFQQARTNLTAIVPLVLTETTGVFSYVMPEGSTNPIVQFYIRGHNYSRPSAGQQLYTVSLNMKVIVERLLAGVDGATQDVGQWDYYPAIIAGFERYGNLRYPGGTPVPFLDELNTTLISGNTSIEGHDFVILLNWNLVFRTSIQRAC
jgi:hypothetical protein